MTRGNSAIRRCALLAVALLAAAGCSQAPSQQGGDELQVVANPVAMTAAPAPEPVAAPAGTVLAAEGQPIDTVAVEETTRTLAVADLRTSAVRLYQLDNPGEPVRTVPLPAPAERLTASNGQLLAAMPTAGQIARIELPSAAVRTIPIPGQPAVARASGDQLLVAVRDRKAVDVVRGDQVSQSATGELYSADDVLDAGGKIVALDRLRTAVFQVELNPAKVREGLRAGDGATNAAAGPDGRVFVVDGRAGALLAFSADPLLLRQRYPVPGGAYAIGYDPARSLVWVTLTERNEVVGFNVAGGEPTEKYRFPTVRQPNSVAVDGVTGHVLVGSASGGGLQVITP